MKRTLFLFCLLLSLYASAQDVYQLAPPLLKYNSVFFRDKAVLMMSFRQPGAVIRYTTDGSDPGENSTLYSKQVIITAAQQTIKARAFAAGFKPSDVVSVSFVKDGIPLKSVTGTAPDPAYSGKGFASLTDNAGGSTDLHGGTWLGYRKDTVTFIVDAGPAQHLRKVLLSLLQQKGSWVYLPAWYSIEQYNSTAKKFQPLVSYDYSSDVKEEDGIVFRELILPAGTNTSKLRIQIGTVNKIPKGLPGENEGGWLFIDEIKLF